MKKVCALLLTLCLVVSLCAMLAACDEEDMKKAEEMIGKLTSDEWEENAAEEKYDNVTVKFTTEFLSGPEQGRTCYDFFMLDGDKLYVDYEYAEGGELLTSVKQLYINTARAVLADYASFEYDEENDVYKTTKDVVYEVEMHHDGDWTATITMKNAVVTLDEDLNVTSISCLMNQKFNVDYEGEHDMNVLFEFANYGTTVVTPEMAPTLEDVFGQ